MFASLDINPSKEFSNELILATSQSRLHTLDLRTLRMVRTLDLPLHLGPPSTMVSDAMNLWVVVGTELGFLSLWDLRFGLMLRSWKIHGTSSSETPSSMDCAIASVRQLVLHPTRGQGKWIMVACGGDDEVLLQTWDVESGHLVEVYRTTTALSEPALARPIQVFSSSTTPSLPLVSSSTTVPEPASLVASLLESSSSSPHLSPNRVPLVSPPFTLSNLLSRTTTSSTTSLAFLLNPASPETHSTTATASFGSHNTTKPEPLTDAASTAVGTSGANHHSLLRSLPEEEHNNGSSSSTTMGLAIFVGGTDRQLRCLDPAEFGRSGVIGGTTTMGSTGGGQENIYR